MGKVEVKNAYCLLFTLTCSLVLIPLKISLLPAGKQCTKSCFYDIDGFNQCFVELAREEAKRGDMILISQIPDLICSTF